MRFLPADQRELFLPLIDGLQQTPPWGVFLRNLVAHTHAQAGFLMVKLSNAPADQEPTVLHVTAPRTGSEASLDSGRLFSLGLKPHSRMRADRVYSLDEMLDYDRPEHLAHQRAALEASRVRFGRWLRITAPGAGDAWLVLVSTQEDFTASAVATLSAMAPPFAAALRILSSLSAQQLQSALAQSTLARLGVAQIAFDAAGRVLAADPAAEQLLGLAAEADPAAARKVPVVPELARQIEAHCAALAQSPAGSTAALLLDARRDLWLLLRKSDLALVGPHAAPAAIGTLRLQGRANAAAAIETLAAVHRLSKREAALAHAIAMGEPLIEAGARLGLTRETARSYSKRIYAKTGTSGQASLAHKLMSGLSALC